MGSRVRARELWGRTERRWNRTIQPEGCSGLPVLKTGWATRPLPLRGRV